MPIRQGNEADAYDADLERRARAEPPPLPFKKTTGRGVPLPRARYSSEFPAVLLSRRTWRGFGARKVSAKALGTLLDLTFGCQLTGTRQGVRVLFRTSPSGGACHPIEAYVLALRVQGVAPGLYHYSPRTRRLYLVRRGASDGLAVSYFAGQSWFGRASALVLMTAVMPRVWWRYPDDRSYRAVLLEAGHFCQTFCLVATWLDLAPFCTIATEDSRIERDLGIDGTREILLYAAGVGSKSRDGQWVQWPGLRTDIEFPYPPRRKKLPRRRRLIRRQTRLPKR